uniref:Uncharacterized protein n=1 Tax=Vitrella brassicaformis TaxID=1169539 RepID=A0A7S1P1U6_9ALVE
MLTRLVEGCWHGGTVDGLLVVVQLQLICEGDAERAGDARSSLCRVRSVGGLSRLTELRVHISTYLHRANWLTSESGGRTEHLYGWMDGRMNTEKRTGWMHGGLPCNGMVRTQV